MLLWSIGLWVVAFLKICAAKRSLFATSLVTCKENSGISANSFDVVFNPDDDSLHYTLDLITEISGYVYADVEVYAYGFKIITEHIDFCNLNWKQFCPLYPGDVQIDSIEYIDQSYVNDIPGIAYQVPDIDAYARLNIYNNESEYLACVQVYFSNGKTISQIGVKWATAVVAGIGLLLSAILSSFGKSTAASHISANTMSLFLYFQSVVIVSMEHVHYVPPIAAAWSENLAWSMGLIRIHFMQKIFRWYVQATGGTPSLYLTSTTISVLTQRSVDYLKKRAQNILYGNANTLIFRGIKRLAYRINIENTSVVCTGFTFFVLCGYVLAGFIMCCKYSMELCIRSGWIKPNRFVEFRNGWRHILKGSLLRYIYIGFSQLTILSFWEFTERDSAAVIVLACLFIVLSVGLMGWSAYKTSYFAKKSIRIHNNPAALLYGDNQVLSKYGFYYTMFNARHYWWNNVILSYAFIKSLFIGFAQASGKTQALALWILDLFYFVAIIYYQPYLDRPTNIVNIFISTVTVVNSFLFMFFSDLFGQPYAVSAIMGWVFFIMNAAFSFILLLMILVFIGLIVFSKNPDLRFKPAKDDRTSFQRFSNYMDGDDSDIYPSKSIANELLALSDVAKDHDENWAYDLQRNRTSNKSSSNEYFNSELEDEKTSAYDLSVVSEKKTLSDKLFRTLSLNRLRGNKNSSNEILSSANRSKDELNATSNPFVTDDEAMAMGEYPGHIRNESESKNGLMSAFDNEYNPEHKSSEPMIYERASLASSTNNNTLHRDPSVDTFPHDGNATRRTDLF